MILGTELEELSLQTAELLPARQTMGVIVRMNLAAVAQHPDHHQCGQNPHCQPSGCNQNPDPNQGQQGCNQQPQGGECHQGCQKN